MKDYLIFLDIDGTILNDKSNINFITKYYLKKFKRNNKIILATGRPLHGAMKIYHKLKLDTPIISNNGGLISNPLDPNFKEIHSLIKMDDIKKFYSDNKEYLYAIFYDVEDRIYTNNLSLIPKKLLTRTKHAKIYEGDFDKVLQEDAYGLLLSCKIEYKDILENYFPKDYYINIRLWGIYDNICLYEMFNKNTSKGKCVKYLINYYKQPFEKTISFGDGVNDFELINSTFKGFAMKNGHDNLLKKAKYITSFDNNHNGVIKELKKIK